MERRFQFSEQPSAAGKEGMPNKRAQGGCGAEPASLTNAIIPLSAGIETELRLAHAAGGRTVEG